MDFALNEDQRSIDSEVRRVCVDFSDDYWTDCEENSRFPHEFHRAMADGGWLGITMPSQLGGAGLGVSASGNTDASGNWSFAYQTVRALYLVAAHAAGIQAIEAAEDTGTVGLDGMTLDIPHLKQARNLIAQARQSSAS